ncbi:hypothetical protein NDU88_000127 [Pleurodeles waltl]|uniref:Uncharacterized protein n=1 Tax=Pleurodeles waltl TaxID=8319 RepID=A0AAV7TFD8_PLEWA|nr:hypothetical protein NDU88_000127 [Pleurodeles waltl]
MLFFSAPPRVKAGSDRSLVGRWFGEEKERKIPWILQGPRVICGQCRKPYRAKQREAVGDAAHTCGADEPSGPQSVWWEAVKADKGAPES